MKHLLYLTLACSALLFASCGHNVLNDYEVCGLDLSIPVFGYPCGIRIGNVKVNSNCIRGNASYTNSNNVSSNLTTGDSQKTNVIQFSANTQVNEGYVQQILSDEKIGDDVKKTLITDYLKKQQAPPVLPVTTKTPTAATAVGEDRRLHQTQVAKSQSWIQMIVKRDFWANLVKSAVNFFFLTTSGKIILFLVQVIGGILAAILLYALAKYIVRRRREKKGRRIQF